LFPFLAVTCTYTTSAMFGRENWFLCQIPTFQPQYNVHEYQYRGHQSMYILLVPGHFSDSTRTKTTFCLSYSDLLIFFIIFFYPLEVTCYTVQLLSCLWGSTPIGTGQRSYCIHCTHCIGHLLSRRGGSGWGQERVPLAGQCPRLSDLRSFYCVSSAALAEFKLYMFCLYFPDPSWKGQSHENLCLRFSAGNVSWPQKAMQRKDIIFLPNNGLLVYLLLPSGI
jgi:hypothetical protein